MGNGDDDDGSTLQKGLDTALKVKELIEEGGFSWELVKEPFSTDEHACAEDCAFTRVDEQLMLGFSSNWPITGWHGSEAWIRIIAEVDGCNVKNARLRPGGKSYVSWYNSRTWSLVVNSVTISNVGADSSGCEECCDDATCIEFDISLTSENWAGSDFSGSRIIRICGHGSPTIS